MGSPCLRAFYIHSYLAQLLLSALLHFTSHRYMHYMPGPCSAEDIYGHCCKASDTLYEFQDSKKANLCRRCRSAGTLFVQIVHDIQFEHISTSLMTLAAWLMAAHHETVNMDFAQASPQLSCSWYAGRTEAGWTAGH